MTLLKLAILVTVCVSASAAGQQLTIQPESCTIISGISSYKHYQHTQDPNRCVQDSGVTTFAGCLAWDQYVSSCGAYASASEVTPYYECYCQTAYLDAIYSCNNEQRLCLGATSIDYGYTNDYNCWYSICDPILRHTPTLAPLSSITAPYEVGFCSTAKAACRAMSGSRSLCAIDYTSGEPTTSVSDCLCAPPVLSLEYTCSFLGNISCIQVPAHFTSMSGWTYCDNFADVLTVPPSVTATQGSTTNTWWTYYTPSSSSSIAIPASSQSAPSPTATTKGNGSSMLAVSYAYLILTMLVAGWTVWFVNMP